MTVQQDVANFIIEIYNRLIQHGHDIKKFKINDVYFFLFSFFVIKSVPIKNAHFQPYSTTFIMVAHHRFIVRKHEIENLITVTF